ncbi:MAG: carbohydrate ABC transporter permease [Planctomycetes bacterium]|nr:carbohydrate ABC transporter permease [Planctomycetota bacterium]
MRQIGTILARGALYVALASLALVFLFPFYWLAVSAFKSQGQIFATPPEWLPNPWRWANFADIYRETHIVRAFLNSVIIAAGHVTLSLFLCSLGGYAFAKYPGAPGGRKLFAFVLGTMMIPGAVTLIPTFVILMKLQMVNTYWAMIVPGAANAFGIFWMRQYIAAHVPDDLLHAARIDGCSEFGIYWHVVLPIAKPALAALGIMLLMGTWNNLMSAFLLLRTKDMQTLPLLIYLLQGETRTPFGMLMAGGLLTVVPMVAAFLLFQRQFIAGITSGAVKA